MMNPIQIAQEAEWGLSITGVSHSVFSGKGVKVALLDSGYDPTHPDFEGVNWISKSFLFYENEWDQNGHGTHNAGLIAGPRQPRGGKRYGVAEDAILYSAKILSKKGLAANESLQKAIEWAVTEGCRIICVPLGLPTARNSAYSMKFETLAQISLEANALIIAPVGNQSDRRRQIIRPVAHPANCPSVLAVNGIDLQNQLYNRANAQLATNASEIGLVGPAVDIRSTTLGPKLYESSSGTSSASAIVAGIAALYLQAFPELSSYALKEILIKQAKKLSLPTSDVGAGLVQAL